MYAFPSLVARGVEWPGQARRAPQRNKAPGCGTGGFEAYLHSLAGCRSGVCDRQTTEVLVSNYAPQPQAGAMSQPHVLQGLQQRWWWQRCLQHFGWQQRTLQQRCLQHLGAQQLTSQPQLGAAAQVGAGAAQVGAAQDGAAQLGAAQPHAGGQHGRQQRWNRWWQRCLQHRGWQQVGAQPQVGSLPQTLQPQSPPP